MMTNYRDSFYNEIQKGLIGPGSDIFGVPENEELISDFPLNRYYSGILFPEKDYTTKVPFTEEEVESYSYESETNENDYEIEENQSSDEIAEEVEKELNPQEDTQADDKKDILLSQNAFFPNQMGLTFCVDNSNMKSIKVSFSFGIYNKVEQQKDIRVAISKEGYNSFFDETINNQLSFKDILKYNDGFMQLSRNLNGNKGGKETRSGEYLDFDRFKTKENIGDKNVYNYINLLELLLGRVWKREQIEINDREIQIINTKKSVEIFKKEYGSHTLSVSYLVKAYNYQKKCFMKILLYNNSHHSSARYSNLNDNLNRKCLFQTKISIKNISLIPYKSQSEIHPFDEEQNEINFIYRDINSFGVGHNCSVQWEESSNPTSIQTTFMPEKIVYGMKNDFSEDDFPGDIDKIKKCLEIKHLSHFNNDKDEIISGLRLFVSHYRLWIDTQKKESIDFLNSDKKIAIKLVERQEETYKRLINGIDILERNERGEFHCFQLANTAMFIQMIIGNDIRFGNNEKQISGLDRTADYSSLDFFEQYNDWNYFKGDSKEPPRYRPFQLAFLLLSIEGIINENSYYRNNIVDLIWFPTGGGKTEAYLAVAAFTILWRRLSNDANKSKGTCIIMRYTLRLLTSQQFERATRLILALEFLRRNFENELQEENISIGLWVGGGASPNSIKEASDIVNRITNNYQYSEPFASKLQVTACPWCGTKFIPDDINFGHGYECEAGRNAYFNFKCINEDCAFHEKLPIQVVDEMLYKEPPTLLFATVDKFAVLASQKDGKAHVFFNATDDSLPPDLIIQDELHLISGPLGSIVGIFESVIDYLCTKGNHKPKIISSTATIRNSESQIKELYAGRKVNVFPPSGISYVDSFFAKAKISKRKYVGFLPTGKTVVNTQLWLLTYLLLTRIKLFNEDSEMLNNYWTIVSYYNTLKDVGKINNKINDEIQTNVNFLFNKFYSKSSELNYLIRNINSRSLELTSRIEDSNIKTNLKRLEENFALIISEKDNKSVSQGLDLVLASNMFSVGIDISRLNVMLINGMPRNITEYIQSSSRIGRKYDGIIITLFNPNRARDKSYFENFNFFNQAFYKFVEPLSITPFTENTIHKMLTTIFIAFLRNSFTELRGNSDVKNFKPEYAEIFKNFMIERFGNNDYFNKLLEELINNLVKKIERMPNLKYTELLKKISDNMIPSDEIWLIMNSLRDVDTETYFRIRDL